MEHGLQNDWDSCGVGTVNTVEHFLAEDIPLFTQARIHSMRITDGIRLARLIVHEVRLQ
jgi:hypothetical protein